MSKDGNATLALVGEMQLLMARHGLDTVHQISALTYLLADVAMRGAQSDKDAAAMFLKVAVVPAIFNHLGTVDVLASERSRKNAGTH